MSICKYEVYCGLEVVVLVVKREEYILVILVFIFRFFFDIENLFFNSIVVIFLYLEKWCMMFKERIGFYLWKL